jgi:hypothetical protein
MNGQPPVGMCPGCRKPMDRAAEERRSSMKEITFICKSCGATTQRYVSTSQHAANPQQYPGRISRKRDPPSACRRSAKADVRMDIAMRRPVRKAKPGSIGFAIAVNAASQCPRCLFPLNEGRRLLAQREHRSLACKAGGSLVRKMKSVPLRVISRTSAASRG